MSNAIGTTDVDPRVPGWVIGFATLAALLLALGAGISLLAPQRLVGPGAEINAAAHVYAGYTFSRDLSFLVALCIAISKRSRSLLCTLMGLFSLINFLDAIMDIKESRVPVFVIAVLLSLVAGVAFINLSTIRFSARS